MKNANKIIAIVLAGVIIAGGAFYGGMVFAKGQSTAANAAQRLARGQGFGGAAGAGRNGTGGFSTGSIIAKDDKSITIQLQGGGSKIVFYTTSTPVLKSVTGAPQDLTTGENVMATGKANSDGSISADSIQIRPAGQNFPGQNRPSAGQ